MVTCSQLTARITSLGYQNSTIELTKEVLTKLKRKKILVENFLQKLFSRANSNTEEDYLDILMQGRIVLILIKNNFPNIQIEYSLKGPDIVSNYYGENIYFEVTRKRPNEDDERFQQPGVHVISPPKTENTIEKIQEKLPQLKSGEINIVVLCSETVKLGLSDVEEALK